MLAQQLFYWGLEGWHNPYHYHAGKALKMSREFDDPLLTLAVLPPFLLNKLAELMQGQGQDVERLCRGLGFSRHDLAEPETRVSYRQADLMIHRALEALPDHPGLGLEVGNLNVVGTLGLVGHAVALCKTLRQACDICSRFYVLTGGLTDLTVDEEAGLAWIQASCRLPAPQVQVFCIEELFASLMVYLRELAGPDASPVRIEFYYPAPSYAERYQQLFNAPVHFNRETNRMIIPSSLLEQALPGHDPVALKQILTILEREYQGTASKLDLAASVERAITRSLAKRPCIADIAKEINMSERTLRRRLAEHDLTFDGLLDNVRRMQAMSLIQNIDIAIERVAELSGYGDARSFRRAFSRWTGMGPREYRKL